MKAINKTSKGKREKWSRESTRFSSFYAMEIKKMLLNKTYNPMKSTEFKIIDGVSRKTKIFHKPKFYPDQIIH